MSELILDYSEILAAGKAAGKVKDYCDDYCEEIKKKVTKKLDRLEKGDSTYTNQARNYANLKIRQLEEKGEKYASYSKKLYNFVEDSNGAKQTDKRVANKLKSSYELHIEKHNIKVNPIVEGLTALSAWGGNATMFGKILKQAMDINRAAKEAVADSIQYWYRCAGGKNVLKVALAAVGAVAAVVGAIAAFPVAIAAVGAAIAGATAATIGAAVVAVAGAIGAVIGTVNAFVNLTYECGALGSVLKGKAAEGLMMSNTDTASDALRKTIFESEAMNKFSMEVAMTIDVVDTACAIIGVADMARNGFKFMKDTGCKKVQTKYNSAKNFVKNGGLKTMKTKFTSKAQEGFKALKKGGLSTVKSGFKDIGKNFKKDGKWNWKTLNGNWKNATDNVNDNIFGNKVLKEYEDNSKCLKKFKNSKFYKGVKTAKEISGYGKDAMDYQDAYADDGWGGIVKEAWSKTIDKRKDIDVIDKSEDVYSKGNDILKNVGFIN